MEKITLKAGQTAAVLNISTKRLQNTVDAGYLRPTQTGQGRGSERHYSFEDVVQMQVLEILVSSYGLGAARVAQMLTEVWPRRPACTGHSPNLCAKGSQVRADQITVRGIAVAAEARIQEVLRGYKKTRPAGGVVSKIHGDTHASIRCAAKYK